MAIGSQLLGELCLAAQNCLSFGALLRPNRLNLRRRFERVLPPMLLIHSRNDYEWHHKYGQQGHQYNEDLGQNMHAGPLDSWSLTTAAAEENGVKAVLYALSDRVSIDCGNGVRFRVDW